MANCKYLKQKLNRTLECKKQNKIINIRECNSCPLCEWTTKDNKSSSTFNKKSPVKSGMKKTSKPSKRARALAISKQVKLIVWERDGKRCIFCHCPIPWNLANSHFVKRSHGGLGIPENVFCACLDCHHNFDDTINREWMLPIAKKYLMSKYENWNEDELIYRK